MSKTLLLLLLGVWATASARAGVPPFRFAGQSVPAGQQRAIRVPVVSTGGDSTYLPITIIHGAQPGLVLGITAGVHGYEYAPIMAAQQLPAQIEPTRLRGTVVLVHVANVPAFLGRSLFVNPVDGKNLNRTFPGRPDGTLTERLAWVLSEQVIARCDAFVDVHAGDGNEDLRPYAAYYHYFDQPALAERARQLALAAGFDYLIQFGNAPAIEGPSLYCSREAVRRGIPAVDIECGRLGQATPAQVGQITAGLLSVLRHQRMLPGRPTRAATPVVVAQRTFIDSPHTGIFYGLTTSGQRVRPGMKLGYITDLFGRHLADVICPVAGVILYQIGTPPVNAGESLFSIAHVPG